MKSALSCLVVVLFFSVFAAGAKWSIPVENWYTTVRGDAVFPTSFGKQIETTLPLAVQYALSELVEEDLASNIEIYFEYYDNQFLAATALSYLIDISEQGYTLNVGNPLSGVLSVTGQAASVYGIAQMSSTSTSAVISDKKRYPYTLRSSPASPFMAGGIAGVLSHFYEEKGLGWDKIGIISSTESYGVSMSNSLIDVVGNTPNLNIVSYQQFLIGDSDVSIEMREIVNSGARVVVTFSIQGFEDILAEADTMGMLDGTYVFFVGPNLATASNIYTFDNGTIDTTTVERMRGTLASIAFVPASGSVYEQFLAQWTSLDPTIVPGAGPGTVPTNSPLLSYDMAIALTLGIAEAEKQGFTPNNPPSAEEWVALIRPLVFEGVTGSYAYNEFGDRSMAIGILNFSPEDVLWKTVGSWTEEGNIVFFEDPPIIWSDNTTNVPDLDIRPAFNYWSCDDKEEQTDPTGKTVVLHTPNGSSFDDIDIDYHCDKFIDCHNFSDESVHCSSNYMILFLVFGIITGVLILISCVLFLFVVLFAFIIPRRRIKVSSPLFLLIIIFSAIVGYTSIFAWFGKPHPVACAFQPWLLGFSVISLISALCAKTWRMWRIFASAMKKIVISRTQILILYSILIAPAILILIIWTIVSTPTADMEDRDGASHFVCTTGGFTGYPGGYIFFGIFVGYAALVLIFAAFLSIVTRNVPSFFNESKLIAISIYNLGFFAVVVIPVVLILQEYNAFAAWIIRTCAILYAFTATLFLQFAPKLFGIVIIDKFKDVMPSSTFHTEGTAGSFDAH